MKELIAGSILGVIVVVGAWWWATVTNEPLRSEFQDPPSHATVLTPNSAIRISEGGTGLTCAAGQYLTDQAACAWPRPVILEEYLKNHDVDIGWRPDHGAGCESGEFPATREGILGCARSWPKLLKEESK